LYPNPTQDKVYLTSNNSVIINSIELFDIQGRKLNAPIEKLNAEWIIETNKLTVGTYYLCIRTNSEITSMKFTKIE
jgi:hypothetical protein